MKFSILRTTIAAIIAGCGVSAQAESPRPVDVPAGDLRLGLLKISEQFGTDLVYMPAQVQGVRTGGAQGQLTTEQAVYRLLEGTTLELRTDPSGAMLIAQSETQPATGQEAERATPGEAQRVAANASEPAASGGETGPVEEVVVTGSNLRRTDAEGVLPVTVLGQDAMNLRDALTPVEMLTALPQVTGVPASEAPRGGSGARGDISTVSLRGLDASATLVLLNGRRLVAHPTTEQMNFAPNINQLPTQGLARIEVLRDGASSIYGSDAVAGVVNYITNRNFEGTQGRMRIAGPEHGGGESVQATLTHGNQFAEGRGRWLTTFDAFNREPIYLRDRDFSASANNSSRVPAPFNALGGPFDGRAAGGVFSSFRVGAGTQTNYFRPVNGALALTNVAPTRANNPEFYGNTNDDNMALGDSLRFNSFTSIEYELNDSVTLFSDLSFYKAESQLIRSPLVLNAPAADQLAPMAIDNPYNPYGSRFYDPAGTPNADGTARLVGTPRTISLVGGPFNSALNEETNVDSQTYRVVGGARGKIANRWDWEVGGLYSYSKVSDKSPEHVRESLFHEALLRTTPDSAYNPFGYTFKVAGGAVVPDQPYTNPQGVYDSFMQEWARYGNSTLGSIDARVSGSLLSIWSGDISAALGAEYRVEKYEDFRPPFAGVNPVGSGLDPNDNDFSPASPKPDASGDRNVTSVYAEAILPLVSRANGVPLVDTLELTASVRHERYSDFGETTKPKVGLNWRPVRPLMIRASYNEGFTAPSLPLLNSKNQWSYAGPPGAVDVYRNTATNEGPYISRNGTSGNPDLQPVDSEGISAGFVLDVPFVRGLSVSADYWQIKQSNLIGSLSAAQIRNSDLLLLQSYTLQQIAAGVPVGSIDLGEGTTGYRGDPAITRDAPTDADRALFAAYNAANPGSPLATAGRVFQIDAPPLNLSDGVTAGWDFSVNYNLLLPIGELTLNTDWSLVTKSHTTLDLPGGVTLYNERLNVDGVTKWRGSTTASWRNGDWAGGLSAYYIGSYADSLATTTAALYESLGRPDYIVKQYTGNATVYRYKVDDVLYFNGFGAYTFSAGGWLNDSTVRLGIINLTDKEPPVSSGNFGFGYSGSVHGSLVAGRTWTLEFSKQF